MKAAQTDMSIAVRPNCTMSLQLAPASIIHILLQKSRDTTGAAAQQYPSIAAEKQRHYRCCSTAETPQLLHNIRDITAARYPLDRPYCLKDGNATTRGVLMKCLLQQLPTSNKHTCNTV